MRWAGRLCDRMGRKQRKIKITKFHRYLLITELSNSMDSFSIEKLRQNGTFLQKDWYIFFKNVDNTGSTHRKYKQMEILKIFNKIPKIFQGFLK